MNTPKPYGLDKDGDLRWESVALVAACIPCESPADLITTAALIARFVKGEITVGMRVIPEIEVEAEPAGTSAPGSAKVIPLGRKPS